jgi:hypothetical protein
MPAQPQLPKSASYPLDRASTNVRYRRIGDIEQPAKEGPVSDPKATFDDAALTGSFCPLRDLAAAIDERRAELAMSDRRLRFSKRYKAFGAFVPKHEFDAAQALEKGEPAYIAQIRIISQYFR